MKSKNIIFAILISLFPLSSLIAAAAASPLDRNQIGRCCAPYIHTYDGQQTSAITNRRAIVSQGFGRIICPKNYADDAKEAAEEACRQALKMFSLSLPQIDIYILDSRGTFITGGSGGLATFGAVVSALTGRPMNPQIAATGIVEEDGSVTRIGSLLEKWNGSHTSGIAKLIVPKKNVECLTIGSEVVVNPAKHYKSGAKLILFNNLNSKQHNIETVPVKDTREAVTAFFGVAPEQLKLIPLSNKRTIRSRQLDPGEGDRVLRSLLPLSNFSC
jgi:predicted ATP-dependent protease